MSGKAVAVGSSLAGMAIAIALLRRNVRVALYSFLTIVAHLALVH